MSPCVSATIRAFPKRSHTQHITCRGNPRPARTESRSLATRLSDGALPSVFRALTCRLPAARSVPCGRQDRHTAAAGSFRRTIYRTIATIRSGFVLIITGSPYLALAEFIVHGTTDWMKCEGEIVILIDQVVHYGCMTVWALVAIWVLP
jgi:hypothetical protein